MIIVVVLYLPCFLFLLATWVVGVLAIVGVLWAVEIVTMIAEYLVTASTALCTVFTDTLCSVSLSVPQVSTYLI